MANPLPTYQFNYYHPEHTPSFYYPNPEFQPVNQTPEQKLDLIGRLQVVSSASLFGHIPVQPSGSVTNEYKLEGRYMATGEEQIDINGLGYAYSSLGYTNP